MPRPRFVRSTPTLLAVAVASLTLTACGGGGGGSDTTDGSGGTAPQSVSGKIVDGYISGASVSCVAGSGAGASTTSARDGAFSFTLPAGQNCSAVEARGGIDVGVTSDDASDDIPRPAGLLRAPVPSGGAATLYVTPASTIIEALVDGGMSVTDAQSLVRKQLGIAADADLLGTDPASDVALYRINAALAQVLEQVAAAIAAAGSIVDDAALRAISDATVDALVAALTAGTTLAQLGQAPTELTPSSPLVALIAQATRNAQNEAAVGSALAGVQPETLSLLAAPLVASTVQQVTEATTLAAVVAAAGDIAERGGAATVIGSLADVLDEVPSAGQQQALLDAMAAAAQSAAAGTTGSATITVGGATVTVQVPGGASNFLQVLNDTVRLYNPVGSTADVTLAQFESGAGASVSQNLSKVGLTLKASTDSTQLAAPREVPLAIDVRDATSTRVVQAIVDRVVVSQGSGGEVQASVPAGAKLTVYGKTSSAETTSPLVVTLSDTAKPISTSGGEITIDIDRLFSIVGGVAASGSPLARLAADRISGGTFIVTLVVGELRIARAISPSDATPTLAVPYAVRLQTGSEAVTGYGVRGRVVVGG